MYQDPINITKEQWMVILEDRDIITEKDVLLLKLIYACDNYEATASRLTQLLAIPHHAPLNKQVGDLGKRIVTKLNISAPKRKHSEGYNWWHVPFLGEGRKKGFYWTLRPELQEAIQAIEEETLEFDINLPEEINFDDYKNLYEGAKIQIYVNSYERNRSARDKCVKYYGPQCVICSFNFEKMYGEVGRDIIHVHHLKPLSGIGEQYRVNPILDLCPICPNCHVIIHKRNPPYSIDEVIAMIRNTGAE